MNTNYQTLRNERINRELNEAIWYYAKRLIVGLIVAVGTIYFFLP